MGRAPPNRCPTGPPRQEVRSPEGEFVFHATTDARTDRGRCWERIETQETCTGFAALDPLGRKIGEVEQLFTDGCGEPRHLKVKIGGLFAARSVLIPVRDVAINREKRTLALL